MQPLLASSAAPASAWQRRSTLLRTSSSFIWAGSLASMARGIYAGCIVNAEHTVGPSCAIVQQLGVLLVDWIVCSRVGRQLDCLRLGGAAEQLVGQ